MKTLLENIITRFTPYFNKDQEGQGMVEYALILVLIAVVVIIVLTLVGTQVNNVFSNVSNQLGT